MAQIFHPAMNAVARGSLFGAVFVIAAGAWVLGAVARSPYLTQADVVRQQPVPFSHKHHVDGMGLDCRYCHTSVEETSFAGMPSTQVCMGCHRQIWADSPALEPVRASLREDRPLAWTRVHDLADFAYFDHSIHLRKGIGCSTCHGRVDQMPLLRQEKTLFMEWCLECHRAPERFVRPRGQVFNLSWEPPGDDPELGRRLVREYGIENSTSCSVCHR